MIILGGKKKNLASVIMAGSSASKNAESYEKMAGEPEESHESALMYAMSDLMKAIHSKDIKGMKEAFVAAAQIVDSMPHEEGEHLPEE